MRSTQFWVLLIASILVTILYVKEITLSRSIMRQQKALVDDQETSDTASTYESAWKSLAFRVYESSRQDAALLDLLKSEGIQVHQGLPPGSVGAAANPPGTSPVPGTSTKPLANPSLPGHPATP